MVIIIIKSTRSRGASGRGRTFLARSFLELMV